LNLSGGQQQRTALARAIVKNASLVLLDEPLANLDYKLREELREELPKIFALSGAIFVYATTEPSEALLLGGNTATMHQGHIAQYGSTIELYRNPIDLVSAKTFADPPLNIIQLMRSGGSFLHNGEAVFPVPAHLSGIADGPVTVAFHPHHLYPEQTDGAVKLAAKTLISEIAGSESFVHVDFSGNRWVMLTRGILDIEPDRAIDIYLDTRHLMAFDANGRSLATPQQAAT